MNHASLSVVVLASPGVPSSELGKRLRHATCELDAQLILVSQHAEPGWQAALADAGELVRAPSGSTRAEMCDMGVSRASGTIVAVRDAADVGDAQWIDAFRGVLPSLAVSTVRDEVLVLDTMDATRGVLADVPPSRALDLPLGVPAIEMAAVG